MGRYEELKKAKNSFEIQTYDGSYDDFAKAYWEKNYTKPEKPKIEEKRAENTVSNSNMNIVEQAANEVVNNQPSYEEQKQSLKEQGSVARRERFLAALTYLNDKLSGENTDVSERKYEAAKNKYSDIKADLKNAQKSAYTNVSNNDDYAEKSKFQENVKDNDYIYINGDEKTRGIIDAQSVISGSKVKNSSLYRQMTQKQISDYNYIYSVYGKKEANDYLDELANGDTGQKAIDATTQLWSDVANEHPVVAEVVRAGSQVPEGVAGIVGLVANAVGSESVANRARSVSAATSTIHDTIKENIGDKTEEKNLLGANLKWNGTNPYQFAYEASDQAIRNVVSSLMLGNGTMGAIQSGYGGKASQAVVNTFISASAMNDSVNRQLNEGVSTKEAYEKGITEGVIEFATEMMGGFFGKETGKAFVDEGLEEVTGNLIEYTWDAIKNGKKSEISETYNNYISCGASTSEAVKNTLLDCVSETVYAFLLAGVSAGGMSTVTNTANKIKENASYRNVGKDIKNNGIAQNVIDEGLASDPNSNSYNIAKALQEKLESLNVDENTQDIAHSMLSDRKLGQLQLANQNTITKENLVNAISSEKNSDVLTKAMSNIAEGKRISRAQFSAIKNSDTAIGAINSEFGTTFTKNNLKKDTLDNISIISSRTVYNHSNRNAPTAEQTRTNIADKLKNNQQQASKSNQSENNKSNIRYNIDATDGEGNAVNITDISTENDKLFFTTNDNMKVSADSLNINNEEQKQILKFARHFPTNAAKSFIAGFEYNSNQNIADYAEGFNDIYVKTISTKNVTKMTEEQAIYSGSDFGLTPKQSFIAYSAAQNSILKSDSKVNLQIANTAYNGTQAEYERKQKIRKESKNIAEQKKNNKIKLDNALKSNEKGAVVIGTPKSSMQRAEVELLDSFAKDKGLSVIVVDSVRDAIGQDANAAAYKGKVIVGLDTQNGMLLPYAGHELFHILKQNKSSSATAKELQNFIIDKLKNDVSYKYNERFNALQKSYKFEGTDEEITDNINEEMAANACFAVLSNEKNFNSLIEQNKSLAQKVKDFFADFVNQIRDRLVVLANKNAEYRALENSSAQEKIVNMMTTALNEYQKNNNTDNGSVIKLSRKITLNMTDSERYEILKNRFINNVPIVNTDVDRIKSINSWEDTNRVTGKEKRILIRKIAEEFSVFKEYSNEDVELDFHFSKNNFRESYNKQGKNYDDYAKMFSVFDDVIENAVGIEVHNRNNEGYKVDPTLNASYVLVSAFQDGDSIIPIKLEIKEFNDKTNSLYVAVSLNKIKMTEVWKQGNTINGVTQNSRSVNISISNLFSKINSNDKSFIKYIPKQFRKSAHSDNPTVNEDIRLSIRENDTEVKRLLKENAYLQDANELLRQELQLTKGHRLNQKQINSVANKLIEKHGAYSVDKQLLTDRLSGLYNYIANAGRNIDENYIWSAANDIGKMLAKDSLIRDTSFYDEYKDLKKRLRETAITVPKSVRKEVSSYADLNKIKIRNNGGIGVDSFYAELSSDYAGLFDSNIINEADQLAKIIEVYESIAPIYIDRISNLGYTMEEYSSIIAAEIFDKYFDVKEMPTFADKKQKELDLLKLHYENTIDSMKKQYQRQYEQREAQLKAKLKNANSRNQEKLIKQQAHFTEMSLNAYHRKKRTIVKNKIANVKKDLSRRLLNPTETSYVPRSLVQSIANICDLINEAEIKDPKDNYRSQNIINELQKLHYNYEQLKNEEDIDYASEYEQEMGTKIALLTEFLEESIGENNGNIVQISQLSLDNLEDIYHIVRDIKNTLVDATQQIGLDEKISNHTRGIRIINQLNDTKGMEKSFIGRYEMETLNPIRAVRKITEYNDDAELFKMINEINLGQRKADKFISDASKPFEKLRKDKKAYKKFSEDLVETNITDSNDKKIQLTENEIVQLIMTVKRNQGKVHLMNGGFILPERKLHAKGKYKDSLSKGVVIRHINPYTVMNMYDNLSDYAKEWYSASQYLFNEQGKNAINEVSMLLKHRKIATAENYIPLSVDTDYTSKEIEGLKIDSTIEGMGSLKSVAPKAKQPLIIGGLNIVVDKHINDVSKYYGLAIPIRNFNKVYSVQTSSYYDSDMKRASVRTALRDKWGSNALKLMDNLISDLQTSRSSKGSTFVDEVLGKVQSGFVQATLAGNISVTIKQAASYPTALANLSGKSLAKGLPVFAYNSKQLENLFNEIDEHTGLHYKRRLGMSSQEIGDLTKENALMSKLPTLINPMKWIQLTDVKTTAALWVASKTEIENDYPDVKVNSEEYWQKVTSLYEDTIENTQPNYDILHRPELQKTTNKLTKAIIMFKTQPLQNTGILYDSAFELRQKQQEYKQNASAENKQAFDNAKRKFTKAVTSQFLAAVTFSAMSLVAAMIKHTMYGYRDENDEVTLSSILAGIGDSMMSLFATLLVPVGGGELYEGIKSLGDKNSNDFVSVPVVTTINDLWDDISDAVGMANKIVQGDKEPLDMLSPVENLAYSVAGVLGIPAKNLVKYSKGIIANAKDVLNGDIGKFESGVERKPKQNADRYGKYYTDGDSKKAKEILDEMIENKKAEFIDKGKTDSEALEEAKKSVRTTFSSCYKKQYKDAFEKKDGVKRSEITRILNSTGLFVYENNKTLSDVISEWEKETQEEQNNKKK